MDVRVAAGLTSTATGPLAAVDAGARRRVSSVARLERDAAVAGQVVDERQARRPRVVGGEVVVLRIDVRHGVRPGAGVALFRQPRRSIDRTASRRSASVVGVRLIMSLTNHELKLTPRIGVVGVVEHLHRIRPREQIVSPVRLR